MWRPVGYPRLQREVSRLNHAHILAAVDGTALGSNAERVARRLATAIGGTHSAVQVRAEAPWAPGATATNAVVLDGLPDVEIPRHAERIGADLIVLGRSESEAVDGRRSGTAEAIVRRSSVATLHVPAGTGWFSRALIALDGTERGLVTLHRGAEVAAGFALPLQVVTVDTAMPVLVGSVAGSSDKAQRLEGRLEQLGVDAPILAFRGDPVEQILGAVTPDDLLIVGHRRGGDAMTTDRVGRRLIWLAPCAVLAIPL